MHFMHVCRGADFACMKSRGIVITCRCAHGRTVSGCKFLMQVYMNLFSETRRETIFFKNKVFILRKKDGMDLLPHSYDPDDDDMSLR